MDRFGDLSILTSINETVLVSIIDVEELLADLLKCCSEGCRSDETQGFRRDVHLPRGAGGARPLPLLGDLGDL